MDLKAERWQALLKAKEAVRIYAHDPSRANADAVEAAWHKIRQLDSIAQWRDATTARPDPTPVA